MKTTKWIFLLLLLYCGTGCIVPINSTFESAKLLDKGDVELQASGSKYYGAKISSRSNAPNYINNNFGFALGYGMSDKFNLKFRFEQIVSPRYQFFNDEVTIQTRVNYFEFSPKFQIRKDKVAMSIPFGLYRWEDVSFYSLDPRVFFTVVDKEKFELNIIPKVHIFFDESGIGFMPGINVGVAFSSDLNRWSVRPELGFDGFLTLGLGLNYYFSKNKKIK